MPVNIHGKQYVMVHERVAAFHEKHSGDMTDIQTEVLEWRGNEIVIKASVRVGGKGVYTGIAHELQSSSKINKTSYVENCETSAIGRALAAAGFGIEAAYASGNEVQNAIASEPKDKSALAIDAAKDEFIQMLGEKYKWDEATTLKKAAKAKADIGITDIKTLDDITKVSKQLAAIHGDGDE